jgi:hypothetical protein
MYEYRGALSAEIAFWQELLNDSGFNSDSPEYQRMVHAIKLAEFRLADLENPQHLQ